MLFNTMGFMYFFVIVICLYFILPKRYSWLLLLGASYFFYMCWNPFYILLIIASTLVDYVVARLMGNTKEKNKRKFLLAISLCMNLGLLFTFKYFNFFIDTTSWLLQFAGKQVSIPYLNVLLPVGISFYTFQTLSYTIDVYRGRLEPEKHLGIFALYVSFFPQLVAGPIERSTHLLPQLRQQPKWDWQRMQSGFFLMISGYFKKVVIADNVAVLVEQVYGNVHNYSGLALIVATIFFAFQIYCDFSGYSDIAIGTAKILGFDLMTNFRRPYLSKSIKEFWGRWHISLSSWFKDYVYIPLGGNRVGYARWMINLLITFTLSGLWHGAAMTFVIWGVLNGVYLVGGQMLKPLKDKLKAIFHVKDSNPLYKFGAWAITMCLVLIGWVFFRADTLQDALYILTHLHTGGFALQGLMELGMNNKTFIMTCISIVLLMIFECIDPEGTKKQTLEKAPIVVRFGVLYVVITMIIIFGAYGSYDPAKFIYFAF